MRPFALHGRILYKLMRIEVYHMKNFIPGATLALCLLICGCSSLTTKEIDNPVVIKSLKQDKWFWEKDEYESVLLTPERRQVLIKYGNPDTICSEAPSDTGLKIDTLINSSVAAKAPDATEGKIDFSNESNTANIALQNKMQSIKYLTEASHVACNMYMNNAINRSEYALYMHRILNVSLQLMASEMPFYYQAANQSKVTLSSGKNAESTLTEEEVAKEKSTDSAKEFNVLSEKYFNSLNNLGLEPLKFPGTPQQHNAD